MKDIEMIYREYFGDVFRYIFRLSGDNHIAEEITAETFFKAMKSLNSFRGECDIRVWLCQIAKNCYYSHLRKSRYNENIYEYKGIAAPFSLENDVLLRDEAKRVQLILDKLPQMYRDVFTWRVYAELSFKQIGQIFGKTENWACVTYHRARKMILERLEDSNDAK
ncbi:MAG: sigma-70 family RNA polymerase sigma factor [Clostridia bacterium]|nr:sigma-70 family RNA polymerase sigma factor [Clostridia bacterium]